jgi:glyoxylase-like metal-dependent hydrolase (beta-lactamase superfamily II)
VIGTDPAYVVDPGPHIPEYLDSVSRWAEATGRRAAGILLTHGHPDHTLGAERLSRDLGAQVWAAASDGYPLRQVPLHTTYSEHQRFPLRAPDELAVIPTPGHTPDSVALWLERPRILFSGDTILGRGTALVAPPEGDMVGYMRSLDAISALSPRLIAPGHGPHIRDPAMTVAEYVRHRRRREEQILRALLDRPGSVADLVARIYTDVDRSLWPLATGSVLAHLDKLATEGRVRCEGSVWCLTGGGSLDAHSGAEPASQ